MVGPSSSHTAGAVRLGLGASRILGEKVVRAEIVFHGSFAATYWGHRTDLAVLAGLLGMGMDDLRIPQAKELAYENGLEYQLMEEDLGDVHPNTVKLRLWGVSNKVEVVGASIGGGRIQIMEIDGFTVSCDGTYTVLVTRHRDEPGIIADITRVLALFEVNIAFLEVSRKARGTDALLVAQMDQPLSEDIAVLIRQMRGVLSVRTLPCF